MFVIAFIVNPAQGRTKIVRCRCLWFTISWASDQGQCYLSLHKAPFCRWRHIWALSKCMCDWKMPVCIQMQAKWQSVLYVQKQCTTFFENQTHYIANSVNLATYHVFNGILTRSFSKQKNITESFNFFHVHMK